MSRGYGTGFRPLHIIIKKRKLYTNHMNVLADNEIHEKYTEIWNKIESLFNEKFNKRGFYNRLVYNNKYIKTKISSYNENLYRNKKLKNLFARQKINIILRHF